MNPQKVSVNYLDGMEIINKNYFSWLLIIIFTFLCFFLLRNNFSPITEVNNIKYIKIAGNIIKVDLALTEKDQNQGLSGRVGLKDDEGMLFVFDTPDKYSFWMKDMNFPIDIIWVSSDFKVIYIKKDATPESYPMAFTPDKDALYVLEVKSFFSEKNNLKIGDKLEFLSS